MNLRDLAFKLPQIDSIKLPSGLEVALRGRTFVVVSPGPYSHLKAGGPLTDPDLLLVGDLNLLLREEDRS